jgi:hypothetical protein
MAFAFISLPTQTRMTNVWVAPVMVLVFVRFPSRMIFESMPLSTRK